MTTTRPPRTEPLRTYPEDAETPPPVPVVPTGRAATAVPDEAPPSPFVFKDNKAFARAEDGTMTEVDVLQAQAAANHAGNADPAIMLRAAASVAAQHPVKP